MTTLSALLLNRGPDAARLHGLRGRFYLSEGASVFFEPAPSSATLLADSPTMCVRCVEWLARGFEDSGWDIRRLPDSMLGFAVGARAFPGGDPDPWDKPWLDREARLESARKAWDHAHGVARPAADAKRVRGLARWRASYETAAERAEREQAEAEAGDHG